MNLRAAIAAVLAIMIAAPVAAETHRVLPGAAWDGIAAVVKPGDEIVLEPGAHGPARVADLAGEPGRPIVIRARDERSLAEIKGLALVRPRHVEVRNLVVIEAPGPGLAILGEASRPARDALVQNCMVVLSGLVDRTSAIRLEHVEGLTIGDTRIEGFGPAAISIDAGRQVRIERIQVVSHPRGPGETAVSIGGETTGVAIDRATIGSSVRSTFALGVSAPDATGSGPLAAKVSIRNVAADRPEAFAVLGSCADVEIRHCTILDPRDTTLLVRSPPAGRPPVATVRFRDNLVSWIPNSLRRFTGKEPDFLGEPGIEYGPNLWFSRELPAATPLLGSWVGRVAEPQVLDLDPRLDNGYRPMEPAAKSFGFQPAAKPGTAPAVPAGSPAR